MIFLPKTRHSEILVQNREIDLQHVSVSRPTSEWARSQERGLALEREQERGGCGRSGVRVNGDNKLMERGWK